MRILLLGNGVMSNIVKETVTDDEIVDMLDTMSEKIICDKEFDIIIDFSNHNATEKIIDFAINKNKPLVIATTGQTEKEMQIIEKASAKIAILKTSNTSIGIKLMKQLVKEATRVLDDFDIEIVESHHNRKIDAPSGTALSLAQEIKKVRDVNIISGRVGKRDEKDLTIHSIRAGNIVGEHSVYFAYMDEIIEIKHTALSRKIFAIGAIKLAKKLLKLDKGLYFDV